MSALSRRSFLTGSTASSPTTAAASGSAGTAVTGMANFYHWRSEDKAVIDTLAAAFAEKYPGASITGQGEVWTTDNQACVAMVAVGTALAQTGTAWGNLARTNGSTCSPNRSASSRCG